MGTTIHLVIKNAIQKPTPKNEENKNILNENSNTNSSSTNNSRENGRGMFDMLGPDLFNSLLTSNPQISQVMEQNPEISHLLNNPSLMRETMELATNPSAMEELRRHQDRAMANLESMPGGFNALQRMYRNIQEPMNQFGSNPFQTVSRNEDSNGHSSTEENTT